MLLAKGEGDVAMEVEEREPRLVGEGVVEVLLEQLRMSKLLER